MRARCLLVVATLLFYASGLIAQEEQNAIIERSIELIAEINEDAEVDYTTLVDDLTAYLERPLDLNVARKEELLSLGFLSEMQVVALLKHRDDYGKFIALEELQAVASLSNDVISSLRYFTKVSSDVDALSISLKEVLRNAEHELFLRTDRIVEEVKGNRPITAEALEDNPNSRYLGSPWRLYTRYRFKYLNRVSIGFTAEKDAGEEFFRGTQKDGFDFYSAHAFISGFKGVEQLAIGDFHVQMGQGLTMWSGLARGKSADLFSIKRNPRGVTPYRSVDENNFLRGAAVTLRQANLELTLFGSSKNRDANVLTGDTLDPDQALSFSSLQTSGFHRTPGEIQDKNVLNERVMGGALRWNNRNLSFGVQGVYRKLDRIFERSLAIYNQFSINSNESSVIGTDYDYVKNNLNLFGEFSRSDNGGLATIHGAYLALDPRLTIGMLYRNYERDFQGVYSTAVAENSSVANEKGLFLGLIVKPTDTWKISAWMDRYSFPWLKFQVDAPSDGYEVMTQVNYKPSKKLEAYIRYRYRERPRNSTEEFVIDKVGMAKQHNYRLNVRVVASETVQLRSRLETTDFIREGTEKSVGVGLFQDVIIRPKKFPINLTFRYALFDSESYDSRLYAYEQDVLYFYSIPAYSGVGSRYYVVARFRIKRNIDFWVKWARWHYSDREVISSGLTEIEGNVRSDIRMQLRFKF
jgi:hypothetical protein